VLQGYYETMMLSVGQTMSTSFYAPKDSPEHTATVVNTQPTVRQDDQSLDILKEDDRITKKSTISEGISDVLGSTEEEMSENGDLEEHSEMKLPPASVFESKDINLEDTEMTSDPPSLEASVPIEDKITVVSAPVSPGSQGTHTIKEGSPSSRSDVFEDTLVTSEEHISEELSECPTEKDASNDCREDITSPFSPDDGSLNVNYERPEDSEDDPDGIASILHLRKESIKGEEMIQLQDLADSANHCAVTVISRRSRHRAGQYRPGSLEHLS